MFLLFDFIQVPLYDVIATHCRLMCHELKPHVKLWLSLTKPKLADTNGETTESQSDTESQKQTDPFASGVFKFKHRLMQGTPAIESSKINEVPLLLQDPVALLILILVNLPTNVSKSE